MKSPCSPLQAQDPGQALPGHAPGAIEGGADPLAEGGGQPEGPGPRLGRDGAVGLHEDRDRVPLSLEGRNTLAGVGGASAAAR